MADTDDSRAKLRAYKRAWKRAWLADPANREKKNAELRIWRKANRDKVRSNRAKWNADNPERAGYIIHKSGAKRRDIPFLFTFEEWLAIWTDSGKWSQRGNRAGRYVMARYGDVGPYAIGNVRICTVEENISEGHRGKQVSQTTRDRMSESAKARHHRRPPLRI
jgi:hypothetical protein